MLLLPWNRAAKTDSLERAALPEATASQAERFERLAALPECDVAYRFQDACKSARILEKPAFLDWAYCLNVELFRKCKNPLGSKGNPLLMKAVLDRWGRMAAP